MTKLNSRINMCLNEKHCATVVCNWSTYSL